MANFERADNSTSTGPSSEKDRERPLVLDRTPPPDHEGWVEASLNGLRAIRERRERRRRKK
jgi:hypothetical protein